jgi:hypothetical protein
MIGKTLGHYQITSQLGKGGMGEVYQAKDQKLGAVDLSARPSGSPTYPLDIFAALSEDRRTLAISVINPTETAQDCDLTLTGVQPVGGAKLWQLTAPPGKPAMPDGFGSAIFSGPPAKMAESSLPKAPATLTLPPASISVYEFAVKQQLPRNSRQFSNRPGVPSLFYDLKLRTPNAKQSICKRRIPLWHPSRLAGFPILDFPLCSRQP